MTSVSLYKIKLDEVIIFILLNLFVTANSSEFKFNLYTDNKKYNFHYLYSEKYVVIFLKVD